MLSPSAEEDCSDPVAVHFSALSKHLSDELLVVLETTSSNLWLWYWQSRSSTDTNPPPIIRPLRDFVTAARSGGAGSVDHLLVQARAAWDHCTFVSETPKQWLIQLAAHLPGMLAVHRSLAYALCWFLCRTEEGIQQLLAEDEPQGQLKRTLDNKADEHPLTSKRARTAPTYNM